MYIHDETGRTGTSAARPVSHLAKPAKGCVMNTEEATSDNKDGELKRYISRISRPMYTLGTFID